MVTMTMIAFLASSVSPYADLIPRCDAAFAEAPTPLSVSFQPQLINAPEMRRIVENAYEQHLQPHGMQGRTFLWLLVNTRGRVEKVLLRSSSGVKEVDALAIEAARKLHFTAAQLGKKSTCYWFSAPIAFGSVPATPTPGRGGRFLPNL